MALMLLNQFFMDDEKIINTRIIRIESMFK